MNKNWTTAVIIILILVFAGYIVIDVALKKETPSDPANEMDSSAITDNWTIKKVFVPDKGQLNAVAVSKEGILLLGGEPFVACYNADFNLLWEFRTEMPVTALAVSGNNVYAAVQEIILVFNLAGKKLEEWGPFGDNSMITSLSANEDLVAFADAGNKAVFILDKEGVMKHIVGKSEEPFVIPSPYFDIHLGNNNILYAANTGKRRIEKRNIDGALLGFLGEPGTDPGAFCGCCNPAHFTVIPGGFVTAEKGINRIKILNDEGEFVEFVSSVNDFVPPLPLDIASPDGKVIYGANPADSKVYVFSRK